MRLELTPDLVKAKRASNNENITNEKVLKELCTQITELADIKTEPGHSSYVMANAIAQVTGVEAFVLVYCNPPK